MCGINGLVGFPNQKNFISCMNEALKHRGPDAQGEWSDNHVSLGHCRLSIIDLSAAANQPFVKDNLVIVYNGEIYNFPELRNDLLKKGIKFRTSSDTEVLLEMFRVYRENSFDKLIGMFAFCVYDVKTKELFLARDYFGTKPLYYTVINGSKFAFSSELKSLLLLPGIEKGINAKAVVSCINYLWVYNNESMFTSIKKLPAAQYIYLRTDTNPLRIKIKQFWELKKKYFHLSEKQSMERLQHLLEDSVRRHLIADVPLGAFLSGGVDSSLICSIAKKFKRDLSTYTISMGMRDKKIEGMPDDNFYARKVSKFLNISHADILVNPDAIKYLTDIVYMLDEPIGDPAAINTYLICKFAKERGIKVLLSGMGADELFAGYRRQQATLIANRLINLPVFIKNILKNTLKNIPVKIGDYGIKEVRWAKRLFSFTDMPVDMAYMRSYSYYSKAEICELFKHNFDNDIEQMYDDHRSIFCKIDEFDLINKMCYTDINMFMLGLNLTYTDRASMAASVEVRVPFIDKELVELSMAIEGKYKIYKNISKYVLKKVAAHYLPDEIVFRPKASFGMPIRAWVSLDLKEMIDDLLSVENLKKRNIFDPLLVRKIIEDDRAGKEDNAYRIYQFLTLELWLRRYLDQ